MARLQAVVVMPSIGMAEVMATMRGGLFVRRLRKASERGDWILRAPKGSSPH